MVPSSETEERSVNLRLRTVQIKKAVTFEEDNRNVVTIDDEELLERCEPAGSAFSQTDPWVMARAANRERDAKVVAAW